MVNYWLFKSDPDCWHWQQQLKKAKLGEEWSGVRNYEARNNMKKMQISDQGFFYHSNQDKAIMGIVEVCQTAQQDSTSQANWLAVYVRALISFPKLVTLADIKANEQLSDIALIKRPRLSVAPISPEHWHIILQMAGLCNQ